MSIQLAVILVPVVFGMMGFAIDLGRLYLVRGELNQAAAAAALAAAGQLIGTTTSLDHAGTVATQTLALNKYNFGSLTLGQDTGNLTSTITDPAYFATVAGATRHRSERRQRRRHHRAPRADHRHRRRPAALLGACSRPVPRARRRSPCRCSPASARRCAPPAASSPSPSRPRTLSDTGEFRTRPTRPTTCHYTFYYNCTGTAPAFLPNSGQSAAYTIINRYDAASTTVTEETDQLFRLGAAGLMSSTTPNPTGSTDSHRLRRHRRCGGSGVEQPHLQRRAAGCAPQPCRRSRWPRCAASTRASTTSTPPAACTTARHQLHRALGRLPAGYRHRHRAGRRLLRLLRATGGA